MASGPSHPFCLPLNEVHDGEGFVGFVEQLCALFYADRMGRVGLTPGVDLRALMIGDFEGMQGDGRHGATANA